ncbi:MAG: acyl-CoA-binding protein [Bacteroidota bacterium]|jgi:diazepam-binding inhibitor (GABA receptor modulating acyl-CoA-binding protein)
MNQQSDMQQQFEKAVSDSKALSERPNNDVLLQLYALYKQATEGDVYSEAPSNPFDIVAKAKYSSWEGLKGKSKEEAMQDYIDLIEKLKQ